jgi:LPXTG-motif cell wall-anchored protein
MSPLSTGASTVETSGSTGIIIGVIIGVILVLVLALVFMRRRRDKVHPQAAKDGRSRAQDRRFDVFISHCTNDDSHDVFKVVSAFLRAKGKSVFNPTTHLTHAQQINAAAMADAVKSSQLVVAALSHGFFNSTYCEAEIAAAKEAGIKVVPTFSGDHHPNNQIDKWVKEYRNHATFGYVFRENVRDVLNRQNDTHVTRTLDYLSTQC